MSLTIRLARETDITAITQVAAETWRATYAHTVALHNQELLLARSYAPAALAAAIASDPAWFYVAEVDGQVVGFAQFVHRPDGYGELARIYVLPAYQRHGLGRALLARGAADIGLGGIEVCFVSVEVDNTGALAFYRRFGFRRNRAHASFLGDQIVRLIELKAFVHDISRATAVPQRPQP
jgi:ribosomal protein S18 acetylase RimI-like enzyme